MIVPSGWLYFIGFIVTVGFFIYLTFMERIDDAIKQLINN
jgi:hypothetical protein